MKRGLAFLFGVLWLALWLVIGEVGAHWWLERHGDALDRTRKVVWADARLGWRQRPGLETSFEGHELRTNELGFRAGAVSSLMLSPKRILVLGPSSAFGWGVGEKEAYSARLGELLGDTTVINGGEIGFSSYQGFLLLRQEEVKALKPELILFAYGVNDVDRHRFYFQSPYPDSRELSPEASRSVFAYRLMARSSLLSLLYKVANRIRAALAYGNATDFQPNPVPSLRVPPREFSQAIHELARAGKALGAKVAVLGTPVHMPTIPKTDPKAEILFHEAVGLYESKQVEEAREAFLKASEADPSRNETWYYLAAVAGNLGRAKDAKLYLEKARATEPYRIHRDVLAYNDIARAAAKAEGVPFVDLNRIFEGRDRAPLFVDPVHPSAEGHRLIAEEIRRELFAQPAPAPKGKKK